MAEESDTTFTRTVARCDSCRSVYVAKVSPDGSFFLDGLADCPCSDADPVLVDPSTLDINR